MKQIIRLFDMLSDTDGVLIDMEYTDIDNNIEFVNLRIHNIINGTVGQLVEVEPVVSAHFALHLIRFLENDKQQ